MKSFIEKIQHLMKLENMTSAQLAKEINISESALSRYISGERTPRIDILISIAKYFSVTVEELTSGEFSTSMLPTMKEMVFRKAKSLNDEDKLEIIEKLKKELHGR